MAALQHLSDQYPLYFQMVKWQSYKLKMTTFRIFGKNITLIPFLTITFLLESPINYWKPRVFILLEEAQQQKVGFLFLKS